MAAGWQQILPIIEIAHARRDWAALGHRTFNEYVRLEYRGLLPRFDSIEERATVVKELTAAGFSQREAGVVSGTSGATANRILNPPSVTDETPADPPAIEEATTEPQSQPDPEPDQDNDQDDAVQDLDMTHAARYVITQLDMAYPHRRNVALLATRYDGGTRDPATGKQVDKAAIIADVIAGLGDQVVESFEDPKGHIVGLAEPLPRPGGSTHLAGLMFRGAFVKSAFKPPQDTATPYERGFKLAQAAGKKLDAILDVAGLDATDAHALERVLNDVEDTLTEVRDFLDAIRNGTYEDT